MPQDIPCDWQDELDLSDIDREAVLLMSGQGDVFPISPACRQWLAELRHHQRREGAHFARVAYREQTVLLAHTQRVPLNDQLSSVEIARLGEIYHAAVATALRQGKPICLTALFDNDARTAAQCVEAMLAPIRRCYQAGMQPAVRIRVSSPRLRQKIVAALENLLVPALLPVAQQPALQCIDGLTESDLKLPGLMMVTAASGGYARGALSGTLRRLYAPHGGPAASGVARPRVCPRKSLGSETATHLYFFAQPCLLAKGLPDGARIASEYAAFFEAARQHRCDLVTLEVLSETAGQEAGLTAALAAAITAARYRTPGLKVRVVTRSAAVRAGLESRN